MVVGRDFFKVQSMVGCVLKQCMWAGVCLRGRRGNLVERKNKRKGDPVTQ